MPALQHAPDDGVAGLALMIGALAFPLDKLVAQHKLDVWVLIRTFLEKSMG